MGPQTPITTFLEVAVGLDNNAAAKGTVEATLPKDGDETTYLVLGWAQRQQAIA